MHTLNEIRSMAGLLDGLVHALDVVWKADDTSASSSSPQFGIYGLPQCTNEESKILIQCKLSKSPSRGFLLDPPTGEAGAVLGEAGAVGRTTKAKRERSRAMLTYTGQSGTSR